MCPVVQAIADRATAGTEEWGTQHAMPPVGSETLARQIKTGFFAARYCRQLTKRYGEPLSISSDGYEGAGGTWVVWVRVWPRSVAKKEIARRVKAGEPLAYNVMTRRSA